MPGGFLVLRQIHEIGVGYEGAIFRYATTDRNSKAARTIAGYRGPRPSCGHPLVDYHALWLVNAAPSGMGLRRPDVSNARYTSI
jgi:hypothetical protein